jgi:hypothetical protein
MKKRSAMYNDFFKFLVLGYYITVNDVIVFPRLPLSGPD